MAQALRRRGIDVLTATEAGLLGALDEEYLAYAFSANRVVVTSDPDFLRLHQRRQPHAGISYCRQGARSIGQLVAQLVLLHAALEPSEMVGRVEFL